MSSEKYENTYMFSIAPNWWWTWKHKIGPMGASPWSCDARKIGNIWLSRNEMADQFLNPAPWRRRTDKNVRMRITIANHKKGKICIYRHCSKPKGRRYMHMYIYMYGVLQTQREEIADYDALVNIKLQAQREEIYMYIYTACSKPKTKRCV